ncbi:MAG TPA: hypothetical protein VHJ83_16000 [Micromonosporaceae bacterium]|jgi:hypothetical protein|nr:hypothetical protein [Micromonosporaceae bacterium]
MRSARLAVFASVVAILLAATGGGVNADPGDDYGHGDHSGPPELPPFEGPASHNMTLVGNSDKEATVNTDLAFWGDLAFAGNYNGFRILDISDPARPETLSDYYCRGPQNDVSVYQAGSRLLLFQSIDRAQTQESCDGTVEGSSRDTPIIADPAGGNRATFGFEGIRIFDVTDPRHPVFLDGVPTACGSHTHTLVPELSKQRLHLYISSYPLGSGVTPSTSDAPAELRCESPHQKISIVTVPLGNPLAWSVKPQPLSDDTATYPAGRPGSPTSGLVKACHDINVFLPRNIAVGSCIGDVQIWDISDPANPTTGNGQPHTHIYAPSETDKFEFIHGAVITWDGEYVAVVDETGGGGSPECDGSAEEAGGQSENGFYYFYPMVRPGEPAPSLVSRYMIPRPQGNQICVSHNGMTIPVKDRYVMSAGYYFGGNTIVDFTDVSHPTEVGYSDLNDEIGMANSWSTYWYNDFVYAHGGFGGPGTVNRGLDVFTVTNPDGTQLRTRSFHHLNPQTQEVSQFTGG